MDAVIRVFKHVNGLPEREGDGKVPGATFCSIRFLVASTQAINLIGKQGSSIKSIQESTGASIRVLSSDEVPHYANSDKRIVEMQGESLKVLKAVEAVVGHLRKFLVDQSVLPLFEKSYNTQASQERQIETWAEKSLLHSTSQIGMDANYPLAVKRDPLFHDRETQFESNIHSSVISLYGQDPGLSRMRSSGLGHASGPFETQIAQTMQIPLSYAEDIIGIGGANIAYIRRTSGAILSVQDEITVHHQWPWTDQKQRLK
ncbi:RNA-binding KH domain-containing protein PEPPER-like [Camellia sinensis]|uniref:RNA-binding KH domain-containing protein PEPPER-like n=1 Tax=Camellia sinensis TaxID=4442 RepID=UPI001036066D|nr:RNA-binding KH domain-containing protein PEPPER-like [Camellia sinensis]